MVWILLSCSLVKLQWWKGCETLIQGPGHKKHKMSQSDLADTYSQTYCLLGWVIPMRSTHRSKGLGPDPANATMLRQHLSDVFREGWVKLAQGFLNIMLDYSWLKNERLFSWKVLKFQRSFHFRVMEPFFINSSHPHPIFFFFKSQTFSKWLLTCSVYQKPLHMGYRVTWEKNKVTHIVTSTELIITELHRSHNPLTLVRELIADQTACLHSFHSCVKSSPRGLQRLMWASHILFPFSHLHFPSNLPSLQRFSLSFRFE